MNLQKGIRISTLLSALITLIIGIIFVIDPIGAQLTIIRIIGAALLLNGLAKLISYLTNKNEGFQFRNNPVSAGILIILGLFLLIRPVVLLSLFSYIFCFALILSGITGVSSALTIRSNGMSGWVFQLIIFAIVLIGGISMLFVPFEAAAVSSAIVGGIFIAAGVLQLIAWIRMCFIKDPHKRDRH